MASCFSRARFLKSLEEQFVCEICHSTKKMSLWKPPPSLVLSGWLVLGVATQESHQYCTRGTSIVLLFWMVSHCLCVTTGLDCADLFSATARSACSVWFERLSNRAKHLSCQPSVFRAQTRVSTSLRQQLASPFLAQAKHVFAIFSFLGCLVPAQLAGC